MTMILRGMQEKVSENLYYGVDAQAKPTEWKYIYRNICHAILTILATASFFAIWYEFIDENNNTGYLTGYGNLFLATTVYLLLYILVAKGVHSYSVGVERMTNVVIAQVICVFVVDLSEILISMAIEGNFRFFVRFCQLYLLMFCVQAPILGILVIPMIRIYRRAFPPVDLIEIYGQKNGLYDKVNNLFYKYHISEAIYASKYEFDEIMGKIQSHGAILINDLPSKQKNKIIKACYEIDKRVYVVPKISDIIVKSSEALNLIDTPMFLCRNREITRFQRFIKRFFDVVLSAIALVVFSPLMLITAIAIKREDGGAVFFIQERCTERGRIFNIIKFRSMKEGDDTLTPTSTDDDRVTRVGRVIRAWRIDELPQLINIIKGDMSIVGPRPERVEHVEKYVAEIPEFAFRLKMKAGLTGYAQVYGKYNTSVLDKLKLDLIYITNYNLITDIQIIFETIKILFLKESTEGFVSSGILEPVEDFEAVREEFEKRE